MSLLVQKFGGTSVANTECIGKVANIVVSAQQSGHQVIAVVSAMSGDTDRLINLAKEINKSLRLDKYLTNSLEKFTRSQVKKLVISKGRLYMQAL